MGIMAISEAELTEIKRVLSSSASADLFAELRRQFPNLSLTRCDASDVTEDPFCSHEGFDLHLVDAADHCVVITCDPGRATGIILAQRSMTS